MARNLLITGPRTISFQSQADLLLHGALYKWFVEAAAIVLLAYIAVTDFRTFKISNKSIVLLLLLYGMYAFVFRSPYQILSNIALGALTFGLLLLFYARGLIGGGDVKMVPVVVLWVGIHGALIFSVLLLLFVVLHLIAVKAGWAPTLAIGRHRAVSYGPSVAAALVCLIALGCL